MKTALLVAGLLLLGSAAHARDTNIREWIFVGVDSYRQNSAQIMTDGPYTMRDCDKVAQSTTYVAHKECLHLDAAQGFIAGVYDAVGQGLILVRMSSSDPEIVNLVMTGPYRTESECHEAAAGGIIPAKKVCMGLAAVQSAMAGAYHPRRIDK